MFLVFRVACCFVFRVRALKRFLSLDMYSQCLVYCFLLLVPRCLLSVGCWLLVALLIVVCWLVLFVVVCYVFL